MKTNSYMYLIIILFSLITAPLFGQDVNDSTKLGSLELKVLVPFKEVINGSDKETKVSENKDQGKGEHSGELDRDNDETSSSTPEGATSKDSTLKGSDSTSSTSIESVSKISFSEVEDLGGEDSGGEVSEDADPVEEYIIYGLHTLTQYEILEMDANFNVKSKGLFDIENKDEIEDISALGENYFKDEFKGASLYISIDSTFNASNNLDLKFVKLELSNIERELKDSIANRFNNSFNQPTNEKFNLEEFRSKVELLTNSLNNIAIGLPDDYKVEYITNIKYNNKTVKSEDFLRITEETIFDLEKNEYQNESIGISIGYNIIRNDNALFTNEDVFNKTVTISYTPEPKSFNWKWLYLIPILGLIGFGLYKFVQNSSKEEVTLSDNKNRKQKSQKNNKKTATKVQESNVQIESIKPIKAKDGSIVNQKMYDELQEAYIDLNNKIKSSNKSKYTNKEIELARTIKKKEDEISSLQGQIQETNNKVEQTKILVAAEKDSEIQKLTEDLRKSRKELSQLTVEKQSLASQLSQVQGKITYPDFLFNVESEMAKVYNFLIQAERNCDRDSIFYTIISSALRGQRERDTASPVFDFVRENDFILQIMGLQEESQMKNMNKDVFFKKYFMSYYEIGLSNIGQLYAYSKTDEAYFDIEGELKRAGVDTQAVISVFESLQSMIKQTFAVDLIVPELMTPFDPNKHESVYASHLKDYFMNKLQQLPDETIYDISRIGFSGNISGEIKPKVIYKVS